MEYGMSEILNQYIYIYIDIERSDEKKTGNTRMEWKDENDGMEDDGRKNFFSNGIRCFCYCCQNSIFMVISILMENYLNTRTQGFQVNLDMN